MLPDIDIWRAANRLILQHGKEVTRHAAKRADELLEKGDKDGEQVWIRIMKAAEALLAPPSAETRRH